MNPTQSDSQCDVLLLFVNDNERQAVMDAAKAIGIEPEIDSNHTFVYHDFGDINGVRVKGLQTRMGASGRGASGAATLTAIQEIDPDFIIAVGVAFGIHREKQNIGEILVSDQVAMYEPAKNASRQTWFGFRKKSTISRGDTATSSERLFSKIQAATLQWENAKVTSGLIVSGEKLIDHKAFKQDLLKRYPEAIGGEMEAAGVYASAELKKKDWIIIKAVCDYADGYKDVDKQKNQEIAAKNAAEFVFHGFRCGVFGKQPKQVQKVLKEKPNQQASPSNPKTSINPRVAKQVCAEVGAILNQKNLKLSRDSLITHLKSKNEHGPSDCAVPEQVLIDLGPLDAIHSLKSAVHQSFQSMKQSNANQSDVRALWEKTVKILGRIVLLSVDYDKLDLANDDADILQKKTLLELDIPIITPAGEEIVFSSCKGFAAKLTANPTKTAVHGRYRIGSHYPESGWQSEDILQTIKKDLWKQFNKAIVNELPDVIDAIETEKLNARIESRQKDGQNFYISVPSYDPDNYLRNNDIFMTLRRELKALNTIIVPVSQDQNPGSYFILGEPSLEGYLIEFFQEQPE